MKKIAHVVSRLNVGGAEKLNKASLENIATGLTLSQTQSIKRKTTSLTSVPERLENLDWFSMALKYILFHVVLNVLSILTFSWFSKSAVNDGKANAFVSEFI